LHACNQRSGRRHRSSENSATLCAITALRQIHSRADDRDLHKSGQSLCNRSNRDLPHGSMLRSNPGQHGISSERRSLRMMIRLWSALRVDCTLESSPTRRDAHDSGCCRCCGWCCCRGRCCRRCRCRGWCWARSGIRLVQKPDRKDRVNFNVIWSPSRLVVRPIKEADPSDFCRNTGSVIPSARLVCVRKTLVHRLASQSDAVREGRLRAE